VVDALTEKSDEGRGVAAICFGEVLSNLRSGDFRMGKPYQAKLDNSSVNAGAELTLGSETSQYQEEKILISIPLVAASETGGAQTQPLNNVANANSSRD
jgi:hypothetical protein